MCGESFAVARNCGTDSEKKGAEQGIGGAGGTKMNDKYDERERKMTVPSQEAQLLLKLQTGNIQLLAYHRKSSQLALLLNFV